MSLNKKVYIVLGVCHKYERRRMLIKSTLFDLVTQNIDLGQNYDSEYI